MLEEFIPQRVETSTNPLERRRFAFLVGFVFALFMAILYISFIAPPRDFPSGLIYNLKPGYNLSIVSSDFYKGHIIKSEFVFKSLAFIFGPGSRVYSGNYRFSEKQNVISVAWRTARGDMQLVPMKVLIPEGMNTKEISEILSKNLQTFDKQAFLKLAGRFEGYLFPDTYFIIPGTKEDRVVEMMNENYNEKIKTLDSKIKSFGKPIGDIIKMASILEDEARTMETRRIVAGILWKRLSMGMALQVDSSFKYINGKTTKTLTTEDLLIDSSYNSYTNKGLPPTPIGNPGLGAIEASITPIKTPYLYFLTDDAGNMHYAITHDEHVANKGRYLK